MRILVALIVSIWLGSSQANQGLVIFCQSELLKKGVNTPWSEAMFYSWEHFKVEFKTDTTAEILLSDVKLNCSVTQTNISCWGRSSARSGEGYSIDNNRITGTYEHYNDAGLLGPQDNKIRGSCARLKERKF